MQHVKEFRRDGVCARRLPIECVAFRVAIFGAIMLLAASEQQVFAEPATSSPTPTEREPAQLTPPDFADPDAITPLPPRPPPREIGIVTPHLRLKLWVGGGKLVVLPQAVSSVFVADPNIADVQPPSPRGVFVFGKKPGDTTLFALDHEGNPILAYKVSVEYDQAALQEEISADAPGLDVRLERMAHGLRLVGSVPTAEAAARLQATAQRVIGPGETLLNQLKVAASTEVNLRVRVAEVSRSVSRELGFNWSTAFHAGSFQFGFNTTPFSGSSISLDGIGSSTATTANAVSNIFGDVTSRVATGSLTLDAMAQEGLVTLLAEPNLTTTSGQPATFQAGGEYPIPIPQGLGTVGIEYKDYGVSVGFTPVVLSNGMISMRVKPEVSELSTSGAYTFAGGSTIPALVTRRAETTVQLASGQSFAIGGLIQNNAQNNVSKIPGLGDIPVLGALFRSTQFQRNETELVIVVTAYVVHPTDKLPALPTDYVRQPTDLERLLLDRTVMRASPKVDPEHPPHLYGPAGFLFN